MKSPAPSTQRPASRAAPSRRAVPTWSRPAALRRPRWSRCRTVQWWPASSPPARRSRCRMSLLSVDRLRTRYVTRGRAINAVDGVSLEVAPGETVGLVGESGCGKSTLGKTILRLLDPVEGSIRIQGHEIADLGQYAWLPFRCRMQRVFQDPFGSLNP